MNWQNLLKYSLIILILHIISVIGIGQDCYKVVLDMSGFDNSPYQSELENAACALKQSLPTEFQDQFKVYDFGFYSLNGSMQGGYQAILENVISEIPTEYYLVFGKQSDQNGIYTKFWVTLKLPKTGNFSCFSEQKFTLIENSLGVKINTKYEEFGKSPNQYSEAEIFLMKSLQSQIESMINCCDPNLNNSCSLCPTPEEIRDFFVTKNYNAIPIKIDSKNISTLLSQKKSESRSLSMNFTLAEITLLDTHFNIGQILESELTNAISEGINATGFCTSNADFCDDNLILQVLNEFEYKNYAASINCHIWENPDSTKADTLFIMFYNDPSKFIISLPNVTITAPYWECGPKPLPDVNGGQNYAITKNNDTYFGYHLANGLWVQSDSVQFHRRSPLTSPENEHKWADGGAFFTGLKFEPSFKAWIHAKIPIIFTTSTEESEFKNNFKLLNIKYFLGNYEDVFESIFQQFKYAGFNAPKSHDEGSSLYWKCDSDFSIGIGSLTQLTVKIEKLKEILNDRLAIKPDLDEVFTTNLEFLDQSIKNPIFYAFVPWALATMGGSQGVNIKVKSIKKLDLVCQNPNHTNTYEIEVLFSVIDNFGVGMSDGAKWYWPGLVEQWVLQHYRNSDCGSVPCYIPITDHEVQTYHKFILCY